MPSWNYIFCDIANGINTKLKLGLRMTRFPLSMWKYVHKMCKKHEGNSLTRVLLLTIYLSCKYFIRTNFNFDIVMHVQHNQFVLVWMLEHQVYGSDASCELRASVRARNHLARAWAEHVHFCSVLFPRIQCQNCLQIWEVC